MKMNNNLYKLYNLMNFTTQSSKPNFTDIFQTVHTYWSDNHIFEQSIESKDSHNQFRFYDGPPFVTWLPHYGHLASSVAKDVIPRYQTMKGKRVDRIWGWDCHGIPIEQKVQTKLGLESNLDIHKVGIEKFIEECYAYTRGMSSEWKRYIDQFARWVDFDNSYKTMDNDYMESVWRVFKTLWDKGLIYKGKRVSMYSTKLETPISNFEVAMDDTYEDVNDPAITVAFDLAVNGDTYKDTFILIWTTTPRTIPANIAAGAHKDLSYVKVNYNNAYYIIAKSRLEAVFANKEVEVIEEFLGEKLIGLSYKPPFDYLYRKTNNPNDHKIYHADFVSDSDGTGIVHQAPEFGEADFQLAKQESLTVTEAMDSSGHYTTLMHAPLDGNQEVSAGQHADDGELNLEGIFYRDANPLIIDELSQRWKLFHKASITHRVAFCPRSGTPLVYKAQDSWFIDINWPQEIFWGKSLKDRCIEENENINRYPAHNKHGRFLKNIEAAPDWGISRTRFWGTPMPIYRSEDGNDIIAIGSREELYELSKNGSNNIEKREENRKTIYRNTTRDAELDMHLPYIDDVRLHKDGKNYHRIPEVLDSWMESASMPYAQVHYPFENKEKFEKSFPADYVVEYTGQVRAWFYVMHVLGVALFGKPAFTNVICHGVIAGNDGRKMSKSLGNFPDPKPTFEQYGGDAVRMSILTTPLFSGGDMSFSEDLILEALKQNILPLWNAFSFFITYANIDQRSPVIASETKQSITNGKDSALVREAVQTSSEWQTLYQATSSDNRLDQWILGELQSFIATIDHDLAHYDLAHSSRQITKFLENLTNWYIRRSRRRFRKPVYRTKWNESTGRSDSDSDKSSAYDTLYTVLTQFCLVASPFMPIITEYIWRILTQSVIASDSAAIHNKWKDLNSVHLQLFPNPEIVINTELSDQMNITQDIVRMGLAARGKKNIRVRQPLSTLTLGVELDQYYLDIIAEELNIKSVQSDVRLNSLVTKICKPDGKIIGELFGQATKDIFALAKSGQFIESEDGTVVVGEWLLPAGSYDISYMKNNQADDIEVDNGIVMQINWEITPELEREWYARDLIRSIQDARKEANYDIADRIQLEISGDYAEELINYHGSTIQEETLSTLSYGLENPDIKKDLTLGDHTLTISLKK